MTDISQDSGPADEVAARVAQRARLREGRQAASEVLSLTYELTEPELGWFSFAERKAIGAAQQVLREFLARTRDEVTRP